MGHFVEQRVDVKHFTGVNADRICLGVILTGNGLAGCVLQVLYKLNFCVTNRF